MAMRDCKPRKEEDMSKQLPEAQQHPLVQDRNLARKMEQERRRREAVSCWLFLVDFVSILVHNWEKKIQVLQNKDLNNQKQ